MSHDQELMISLICLVIPLFISLLGNIICYSNYISMKQSKEMYRDTCNRLVNILEYKDSIIKEYVDKYEKIK